MSSLAKLSCEPITDATQALKGEAAKELADQLGASWSIADERQLKKTYNFPDFVTALAFVNKLGELAEQEQHHPDILLCWGKVEITLWTHSIGGLSRSDFIMAAKCDLTHQ